MEVMEVVMVVVTEVVMVVVLLAVAADNGPLTQGTYSAVTYHTGTVSCFTTPALLQNTFCCRPEAM